MKIITRLFESVERFFYRSESKRIEAYLSKAQSVEDLERRFRALDNDPETYLH